MSKLNLKQNKLPIIIGSLALVTLMAIIYAAFTGQLNINGTANVRDSKWDIHIVESGQLEPSNTLSSSAKVLTKPTASGLSISDFNLSLTTPGDYIEYTFHVVNDGDYDATLADLDKTGVVCTANGSTSDPEAVKVCDKLEYTLKYDNGSTVAEGNTILSKQTQIMVLKIKYQEFNDATLLPTANVSISGLGIEISYTQNGNAKVNPDGTTPYQKPTAVSELLAKANAENTQYEQGSVASHQMYTFSHPATEQTDALTDYRYIGIDPYNYVDFNCDDNGEDCETWRIVGLFTVKNGSKSEQRIKLIREERLDTSEYWDSNNVNEWPSATLNAYLNDGIYQSMSNLTKSMIEPAETYLGGSVYNSTTHYGTAADMYIWERGTNVYSGRSLNDTKNITLLYPSDYTYTYANGVDNVCYSDGWNCYSNGGGWPTNGWLYKSSYWWWLVSPFAGSFRDAFSVYSAGRVNYGTVRSNLVNSSAGVRPVVYLASDISFEEGHTGSSDDHYVLKN